MAHARIRRFLRHGTLPQLAVFDGIARLGSFTRAADELHLAQPTVSTQIRKLAGTVGAPLFERAGTRVRLTEAGRRLHAACRDVFGAFERLEDALAAVRRAEEGRLRLAIGTSVERFAARMLARYAALHPGIEVALEVGNRRRMIERLARGDDDLALFADPPESPAIVRQAVLPNPLAVFARAGHPLSTAAEIPFPRAAAEPFIVRESGSGTREITERVFAAHGLEPRVRMQASTGEAIRQAVLAGLGLSILPLHSFGLETPNPMLIPLDVVGFPVVRVWQFAYPAGREPGAAARAFMDLVRLEAQRHSAFLCRDSGGSEFPHPAGD